MAAKNLNRTLAPPVSVVSKRIKRSLLSLRFPPRERGGRITSPLATISTIFS